MKLALLCITSHKRFFAMSLTQMKPDKERPVSQIMLQPIKAASLGVRADYRLDRVFLIVSQQRFRCRIKCRHQQLQSVLGKSLEM